jgi:hypothetical protein
MLSDIKFLVIGLGLIILLVLSPLTQCPFTLGLDSHFTAEFKDRASKALRTLGQDN